MQSFFFDPSTTNSPTRWNRHLPCKFGGMLLGNVNGCMSHLHSFFDKNEYLIKKKRNIQSLPLLQSDIVADLLDKGTKLLQG